MKTIAKLLTFITILALLGCGYLYVSRTMRVTGMNFALVSAADRPDDFTHYRDLSEVGDSSISMYESYVADDPTQYNFAVISFTVTNWSPFPAEWISLDIEMQDGDVMQIKLNTEDIPAYNQAQINTLLMTNWGVSDYAREATLTYYIYGNQVQIPLSIRQ